MTGFSVLNAYAVTDAGFAQAAAALVARVQAQGDAGVLSYRLFADGAAAARLLVRYADDAAWVGHHDRIMAWPEMAAFRATARLTGCTVLGPVTPAMQDWMDRNAMALPLVAFPQAVAGFDRQEGPGR